MKPMFDMTKPAQVLIDTPRLQRLLANNKDPQDRDFIIKSWIADQNRNSKSISTLMGTDTFANIVGLNTFPKLTDTEFQTLIGALGFLAESNPDIAPIVQKLQQFEGIPSLQTCFDAEGFSSEAIETIPELAKYECVLFLSAHIRVVESYQNNAE
jgi:hypothetical protein